LIWSWLIKINNLFFPGKGLDYLDLPGNALNRLDREKEAPKGMCSAGTPNTARETRALPRSVLPPEVVQNLRKRG
jgi:hypothetical protein